MRVPLMLVSIESARGLSARFTGLGKRLLGLYPGVRYDLRAMDADVEAEKYAVVALLSAIIWGALFWAFAYAVLTWREMAGAGIFAALLGACFFLLFFILHLIYPGMIVRRIAEKTDRMLTFALRDLLMQVTSGVSLFDAMGIVAKSDYGYVSKEFEIVVREVSSGMSEAKALERMAFRTKSEYLKKAIWQLVTAIQSGSSLAGALRSVIDTLVGYQYRAIKSYSADLNFIILVYLLIAAVVPSLGITLLVILSAFSGLGVNESLLAGVVIFAFIIQLAMIGIIKNARPEIYV
ncbi:MAG: type II secretion system F family protein [Candidatus Micrarchaeota archaeon]